MRSTPGPLVLELHCAAGPRWLCEADGEPFPCSVWPALPMDDHLRGALLAGFTLFLRPAIRDLRGR